MTFWGKKDRSSSAAPSSVATPSVTPPKAVASGENTATLPEHTVSPAMAARYLGYIDSVYGQTISGWCCDTEHPDRSVAVEVLASNGRRLVTFASVFRHDVQSAGWGNGNHGFEIDTSKLDLANDTVTVRFLDSKVPISKEPILIDSKQALLSANLPRSYLVLMQQLAIDVQALHSAMQARNIEAA